MLNTGNDSLSVMLGDGQGGFLALPEVVVGGLPYSIGLGDWNGDQKIDMAISLNGANKVAFLLGDGQGHFGALESWSSGDNPRSVAVGDWNGDKKPDVVTTNYQGQSASVFLNQSQ